MLLSELCVVIGVVMDVLVWMIALKKYVVGKQMRVRKRLGMGECIETDWSVSYLDMTADDTAYGYSHFGITGGDFRFFE